MGWNPRAGGQQGGETRLFSRSGYNISRSFPDVMEGLPQGVVLMASSL